VIKHSAQCEFHWAVPGQSRTARNFLGQGVALVEIEPGIPHAVLNSGSKALTIVSLMEFPYDPVNPDVKRAVLVPEPA
jgi:hypothetical protein